MWPERLLHVNQTIREIARATDFMVNEMDWDYFTTLHIVTKLERQGDLVLDEESGGISLCWRNDGGAG